MSKYLNRLKFVLGEKPLPEELTKPTKPSFVSFGSAKGMPISEIEPPPLDAEGVPRGGCPSCGRGEFWRWPEFHREFDSRGWRCWFCEPPPPDSGPCDFCGVPDRYLRADGADDANAKSCRT
jgi:hypothetical protein